jgi:hypothetical protein
VHFSLQKPKVTADFKVRADEAAEVLILTYQGELNHVADFLDLLHPVELHDRTLTDVYSHFSGLCPLKEVGLASYDGTLTFTYDNNVIHEECQVLTVWF